MDVTLFMIFLLQGLWETEAFVVTKNETEKANIICRHSNANGNVKYFCKDPCAYNDILITSTQKETGRYKIKDEGNVFFVTISNLIMADRGKYWCGVDRAGVDTYNEVVLQVLKKQSSNEDNKAPNTNGSSYEKLVYIGAGLGTVVLALAVVLLIFMRHRKKDIHKSKRKDRETVYAIPLSQRKDGQHDITASLGNEQKDIPSEDGLLYSSVSFVKHPDCSPSTPRPPTDTNPSFKHVQTDESTVYSSVKTLCL